jgi:hypothetical protein
MFVTVGMFNLIMAIFIENVASSSREKELAELDSNSDRVKSAFKQRFVDLISEFDESIVAGTDIQRRNSFKLPNVGSVLLSAEQKAMLIQEEIKTRDAAFDNLPPGLTVARDQFTEWLHDGDFLKLLKKASIDTSNKLELFDVLDVDMGGELGLDEIVTGMMMLRGPVTKSDQVATRLQVQFCTQKLQEIIDLVTVMRGREEDMLASQAVKREANGPNCEVPQESADPFFLSFPINPMRPNETSI